MFSDGPGDRMVFRGVEYHGQTAKLDLSPTDLIELGDATKVEGYALDPKVYGLAGVDDTVAVVMRAADGAGGPFLLFVLRPSRPRGIPASPPRGRAPPRAP